MVWWYFIENYNALSSLSSENGNSHKLRLDSEWANYIRKNGFESVKDYSYKDETIMKTSEALLKYGYEKIWRVYDRTYVKLK